MLNQIRLKQLICRWKDLSKAYKIHLANVQIEAHLKKM
jgi:hypothetical protein